MFSVTFESPVSFVTVCGSGFSYQVTVKKSNAKRFSTSLRDLVESTETFESIHPTTSVKVLELEHTDEEYSFFTNDPYFL